jgi:hypothetical protein
MRTVSVAFFTPLLIAAHYSVVTVDEEENRIVTSNLEEKREFRPISYALHYRNASHVTISKWNADATQLYALHVKRDHHQLLNSDHAIIIASRKCCTSSQASMVGMYRGLTAVIVANTTRDNHLVFFGGLSKGYYTFKDQKILRMDPVTQKTYVVTIE